MARSVQPELNYRAEEGLTTIYMPILDEGVDVWRPVEAMKITDLGYMLTQDAPRRRVGLLAWSYIGCEERLLREGTHLVAVGKAT
jgi:hypothetical protein